MLFLVWLLLAGCCFCWSGAAAGDKGHGTVPWALAGHCFGPIALLTVIALPDLKQRRILKLMAEHQGVDFSQSKKNFQQQSQKPAELSPQLNDD